MSITDKLDKAIRTVPDYPKPGIQFKDITPVLKDPVLVKEVTDALIEPFRSLEIEMVAGIESRGFIFGPMMARALDCGFTLIRKKGKLPGETYERSYALEYGEATIEMHKDAFDHGKKVLVHDDLLATGGTAGAAAGLIQEVGGEVVGFSFLIELAFLKGSERLQPYGADVVSLINY